MPANPPRSAGCNGRAHAERVPCHRGAAGFSTTEQPAACDHL
nr:MAG TPA: hypothetical protein [Caudoviricetes sp.]